MRYLYIFFALSLCCGCARSPEASSPKLSDAYAKAAMLALRAIDGDDAAPTLRDGKLYTSRRTAEAIEAADVQGVTPTERATTSELHVIYDHRLALNQLRETKRVRYEWACARDFQCASKGSERVEAYASQKIGSDAELAAAAADERPCLAAFDENLRARLAVLPPPCKAILGQ